MSGKGSTWNSAVRFYYWSSKYNTYLSTEFLFHVYLAEWILNKWITDGRAWLPATRSCFSHTSESKILDHLYWNHAFAPAPCEESESPSVHVAHRVHLRHWRVITQRQKASRLPILQCFELTLENWNKYTVQSSYWSNYRTRWRIRKVNQLYRRFPYSPDRPTVALAHLQLSTPG